MCPAKAGQARKQGASSAAELSVNWLQRAGTLNCCLVSVACTCTELAAGTVSFFFSSRWNEGNKWAISLSAWSQIYTHRFLSLS